METKLTLEEVLTRGAGNFLHCTDYEDAIEAIKKYSDSQNESLLQEVEQLKKDKKELEEMAKRYSELEDEISKFYEDEEGDLCDIGEVAASHFGFM